MGLTFYLYHQQPNGQIYGGWSLMSGESFSYSEFQDDQELAHSESRELGVVMEALSRQ